MGELKVHLDRHIDKGEALLAQHALMKPPQAKDVLDQIEAILPLGKSLLEAIQLRSEKWKLN